jgi:hypothetical protein
VNNFLSHILLHGNLVAWRHDVMFYLRLLVRRIARLRRGQSLFTLP